MIIYSAYIDPVTATVENRLVGALKPKMSETDFGLTAPKFE